MEPEAQKAQVSNIVARVFGKKKNQNLLDVYDYLMFNYGYIPYEEFKKMDAHVVNELVIRCNARNEKLNKQGRKR